MKIATSLVVTAVFACAAPAAQATESSVTVVLTSYSAFGGRTHNSSFDVAVNVQEILADNPSIRVIHKQIPTEWATYDNNLRSLVQQNNADAIISFGERPGVVANPMVELLATNIRSGTDASNAPAEGVNGDVAQINAPTENRQAQQAAYAEGYTITPSFNAGSYLCNAALYTNLSMLNEGLVSHAGFVHVTPRAEGSKDTMKDAEAAASFIKHLL